MDSELAGHLYAQFVKGQLLMSCTTAAIYDILCSLDEEVYYVWSQKWSYTTLLYALNRFAPLVDMSILLSLRAHDTSPEKCKQLYSAFIVVFCYGIIQCEVILMLRTYAMWEKRRSNLITLCCLATLTTVPGFICAYLEVRNVRFVVTDRLGCGLLHTSHTPLAIGFIAILISETGIVLLTLVKAVRDLRHSRSSWVVQLYKDGVMFYLYLLAFTISNIIAPLVTTVPEYKAIMPVPQRIFHSILCNKVLLLILRQRTITAEGRRSRTLPTGTSFQPTTGISTNVITTFPEEDSMQTED